MYLRVGVGDGVDFRLCDVINVYVKDVVVGLGKQDVVVTIGVEDGVDHVGGEVVVVDVVDK